MSRQKVEHATGLYLVRAWRLFSPEPARLGWFSVHPCKNRWEGDTLRDVVIKHRPDLAKRKGWI